MSDIDKELMQQLQAIIDGYQQTALVYFMAKTKLADLLIGGPKSIYELAKEMEFDEANLRRVLRGLQAAGFCYATEDSVELTPLGKLMSSNELSSFHNKIMVVMEQWWPAWAELTYSVKTGLPAFDYINGTDPWTFRKLNPELNDNFNTWLSKETAIHALSIAAEIDFLGAKVVADIGGGNGALLTAILRRHTNSTGILFDQPHVINAVSAVNSRNGLDGRLSGIEGDFFDSIGISADVFLLKSVLHDWDDAHSIKILSNCSESMGPKSRLLIIERLLDDENNFNQVAMLDLHMLLITSGRERSFDAYKALIEASGLNFIKKSVASCGFHILEASKIG